MITPWLDVATEIHLQSAGVSPGRRLRAIHWMTTARTAKLMLKETEAEDQRIITLAVFTVAADAEVATFERALSIAAL